jgi:hypothetical protein
MHDIFPNSVFEAKSVADFKVQNMILFPKAWSGFHGPAKLKWESVKFSATKAKEVPNDKRGVYTFVVQPGIACHPACSYLLYVGMTTRDFRVRYQEYLADLKAGIGSRRPHIAGMLAKWDGYLWFYYAEIKGDDKIEEAEDALLEAYLPPTNIEMPGKLRNKMAFILGT